MTQTRPTPGRLAQVIATRGGLAPPEAPFVIEHREALYYMLCQAAELEHGIMCQYLFAAFSLKQSTDEGLTDAELAPVQKWRKQIFHIAAQEMLHLSLVQNMLTAIGGAPHLSRPNFPHPASHYPAGVHLALLPFGEQALRHFMFLERPEGMDIDDAEGMAAFGLAEPAAVVHAGDIVPRGQDFATVGHLYRSIEAGIAHLADKFGERWLFAGPPRAQATQQYFGWPELIAVTGAASAQRAIDEILEQGEGPRGHWRDAHFGQFVAMLDSYDELRRANPAFDPVRPVVAVNVRPGERDTKVPVVTDALTARVMDLFNVCYEILLLMLQRFFAHTEETDAQLKALADAGVALMVRAIEPLGDVVTTLPAGPEYPGRTAGPSFELFYETDCILPHRDAAWLLLAERLQQAADFCQQTCQRMPAHVADRLTAITASLDEIAGDLAAHLPVIRDRLRETPAPAEALPSLLDRAAEYFSRTNRGVTGKEAGPAPGLAALLRSAYQVLQTSQTDAALMTRIVDSVLRPLADALEVPAVQAPAAAIPASPTLWDVAVAATRLRAELGAAAPPGLVEAVAALQDLAVRRAPAGERGRRIADLADLQRGLPPAIVTAKNGPYLVSNVPVVRDHLGNRLTLPPQLALCRCGGSSSKPFCDGTHAGNGFSDDKDPNRVPDRRDTYAGQQLTVFDNRGICQHSGLCTDRVSAAFRAGAEPFVAPSGARLDEIMRAVRDCPSGALSLGFDGTEARDLVDWHGTREQAIEITKDGPYRVTGGIPLADAAGADVPRASGSSREHYALCRCGHSQNKPLCSGMHWYVDFRDPAPGPEPALFEWAGGLPGLTRMMRLLYEKHVPADDLLAPLFATMAAEYPRREAAVLAEAFGGPPADGTAALTRGFTDEQRARWVTLAARAADEAVLPAKPEFRAALTSYLEWSSRAGGTQPPRWDWGPTGPPALAPAQAPAGTGQPVTLPGPGQTMRFEAHIKPLFREHDRTSMSFAFDLWSRDDVQAHAAGILDRLRNGTMPCDGAWPPERIEVFQRWTESGFLP
ncbi:MAG: CDGSH iron-sulfur domain-containing protein [Streptosporangiaceae bacterium]|nr:CDGSH iron-sulfur domain-containing protein [Streptosporangiaceae bacterium]